MKVVFSAYVGSRVGYNKTFVILISVIEDNKKITFRKKFTILLKGDENAVITETDYEECKSITKDISSYKSEFCYVSIGGVCYTIKYKQFNENMTHITVDSNCQPLDAFILEDVELLKKVGIILQQNIVTC